MSGLADAKYDICRNYRLDDILKCPYGVDEMKKDLFDFFHLELSEESLIDDESPEMRRLMDELSTTEDELADAEGEAISLGHQIEALNSTILELRNRISTLEDENQNLKDNIYNRNDREE